MLLCGQVIVFESADVAVELVAHPRKRLCDLVMFVSLFDETDDAHVGNETLAPAVHVNVAIDWLLLTLTLVPELVFIVPLPPFAFSVTVTWVLVP